MRSVQVTAFDNVDKIYISEGPIPEPQADEVLINVHAAPVNFVDLVTMKGKYQFGPRLPYTPGKGPVGTVVAIGKDVDRARVGDRVLAMAESGGYADYCVAPAIQTYRLPNALDFIAACQLSLAFDTAWMALVERSRLVAGETVLVLGASGAVGRAAMQLSKAFGAGKVIAGVSSRGQFEKLKAYGADAYVEVVGTDLRNSIREDILNMTGRRGVDVALDMLGGDVFDGAVRALDWCGRLVIIGFATGRIPTLRMNYPMLKNIEISGLQISDYRIRRPELLDRCYNQIFDLAIKNILYLDEVIEYPLEDWRQALESVELRSSMARVVLKP